MDKRVVIMKNYYNQWRMGIVIAIATVHGVTFSARSPFRPCDPTIPVIHVSDSKKSKPCTLRDSHLEEYAIFKLYDDTYFNQHLLPTTIQYRLSGETTTGSELSNLIEETLKEVAEKRKEFTHCSILQDRDFNRRKRCGLIVLKFNKHPFVIKLFLETAESFADPQCKGFIPSCLFYMGGGVTRHTSGFTRIKNAEYIRNIVAETPAWKDHIEIPRKWFWIPKNPEWLEITGHNIGGKQTLTTRIPAIYAIIADAIETERSFALSNYDDRSTALELCQLFHVAIDPHITNFMIDAQTKKIAIIDTEHFPTIVGLKTPYTFNGYTSWYMNLTAKCFQDMLTRSKGTRVSIQLEGDPPAYKHLLSLNQSTHVPCA